MQSIKIADVKLLEYMENMVWAHYSEMHKKQIVQYQKEVEISPQVGIFWLVPVEMIGENTRKNEEILLYLGQDIASAAHTDMFYDTMFEHYVLWDSVQRMFPKLKNVPYEKYPRGRVTLVAKDYPKDGTFKLMADVKILKQRDCVEEIKRVFNLTDKYKIEILKDAHYRT